MKVFYDILQDTLCIIKVFNNLNATVLSYGEKDNTYIIGVEMKQLKDFAYIGEF